MRYRDCFFRVGRVSGLAPDSGLTEVKTSEVLERFHSLTIKSTFSEPCSGSNVWSENLLIG